MDTTKQYVEMCEKAVEIQSIHDITDYEHDIVYCRACGEVCHEDSGYYFCCGETDGLWLPQQDDLQKILKYQLGGMIMLFHEWIGKSVFPDNTHDSMEQLWLAFVMKELHGKVWNGTDWIKE